MLEENPITPIDQFTNCLGQSIEVMGVESARDWNVLNGEGSKILQQLNVLCLEMNKEGVKIEGIKLGKS